MAYGSFARTNRGEDVSENGWISGYGSCIVNTSFGILDVQYSVKIKTFDPHQPDTGQIESEISFAPRAQYVVQQCSGNRFNGFQSLKINLNP